MKDEEIKTQASVIAAHVACLERGEGEPYLDFVARVAERLESELRWLLSRAFTDEAEAECPMEEPPARSAELSHVYARGFRHGHENSQARLRYRAVEVLGAAGGVRVMNVSIRGDEVTVTEARR